jgi:O-acetyl-ADP-ribose deacetylase (regulator of RNase III)
MSIHVSIVRGDITKIKTDAIVNAANSALRGGGGVDGAIHRAGGPSIMDECNRIREEKGGCPTGEAVVTTAGNLPAKFVIHAVGPVWQGGARHEKELLANAYRYSLLAAVQNGVKSITFPNISTGVYGFPKKEAAAIVLKEIKKFISRNQSIEKIIFVCFDEENFIIYNDLLSKIQLSDVD